LKPSTPAEQLLVRLTGRVENLALFIQPVLESARSLSMGVDRQNEIELAVEESLVNIFTHAYPEAPGFVELNCTATPDRLIVTLEDEGIAFSLPEADAPDLSSDLSDRKIGGLGIHLIQSLCDEIRYRREGGKNRLELIFFNPSGGENR